MRHVSLPVAILAVVMSGCLPARAECRFSPFSFFPDRNDAVQISVETDPAHACTMGFTEGPGYRFTAASFLAPPPHGVLAKTGPTQFRYQPFAGYRGRDSYALKLCAVVNGRRGCSSLIYSVEVD